MRRILVLKILFLIIFFAKNSVAQFPIFESNDRVCFIGNSITMNGRFYNYLQLFYATRFPDSKIQFFNCGISGDITGGVLKRLQSDILVHNPTWSVLMIGMNDVNRQLYGKSRENEAGIEGKREEALSLYFANVDSLVKILILGKSKVILQTPSIYDQTAELASANFFGVNDALGKCAIFLKGLAVKYNLPVVDYWTVMGEVNKKIQENDPGATIVGEDRVHPGVMGHFLMAYEFLKAQQAPEYVSLLSIDRKKQKVQKAWRCTISDIKYKTDDISFVSNEISLPYPRLSADFNPDSLFSFTDDFNKEILQVKSLKKGSYLLTIDSVVIGEYSQGTLEEGINLANNALTPQYQQSLKILKLLFEYWKVVADQRAIKYVEFEHLSNFFGQK